MQTFFNKALMCKGLAAFFFFVFLIKVFSWHCL